MMSSSHDDDKNISVMFNGKYGGFGFSKDALKEYNKRKPIGFKNVNSYNFTMIERTDPLMVQICREMGERANGRSADICIKEIPRKYAECYSIHEYDGLECVSIAFEKYQLDCIRLIMASKTIKNDDKVNLIQIVLSESECTEEDESTTEEEEEPANARCDDDEPIEVVHL